MPETAAPIPAPAAPRVALSFLTRLPAGQVGRLDGPALRDATGWFPAVGALVGVIEGVTMWGLQAPFGPLVAAVVAVLVAVVVTGAFHEDGLADACDGLFGGWTPQRRVEIMRDSRLGTYGTVALVGALGLRVAVLASLPTDRVVAACVTAHVVSRAMILVQIRSLPAATDQGTGATVAAPVQGVHLAAGVVATAAATVWWGWDGAWVLFGAVAGWFVVRHVADRLLDGLTGDVLGATQQVAMVGVLLALTYATTTPGVA